MTTSIITQLFKANSSPLRLTDCYQFYCYTLVRLYFAIKNLYLALGAGDEDERCVSYIIERFLLALCEKPRH